MMNRYILYNIILAAMLFLAGCQRDYIDTSGYSDGFIDATFHLHTPGASNREQTKAMDDYSDNKVSRADVLVFKVVGGNETFAYHASTKSITTDGSLENLKNFTVRLVKDANQYRFVVLTNLTDTQGDELKNISIGTAKNTVLSSVLFSNPGMWAATSPTDGDFTPIPMWGESSVTQITDLTTSISGISVARMLARVNVAITGQDVPFKLKTVHLYNRKTRGNVVPDPLKWSSNKATAPTIPADDDMGNPLTVLGPLEYAVTNDKSLENTIFTFEAAAPAAGKYNDATCVVVGGLYDTDSKVSYYRLDFNNESKTGFRDVLRNHTYKVNIASVTGPGYATSIDAFKGLKANIDAQVIDWNDLDVTSVFNGTYVLNVSKGKFNFGIDSRSEIDSDNLLTVFTDHPLGWTIDKIIDPVTKADITWLSANSNSGATMVSKTVSLLVGHNDSGDIRTGHIYIKAGNLSFVVEVIQTLDQTLALSIKDENNAEIDEIMFPSAVGQPYTPTQKFTVRWKPFRIGIADNPCNYVNTSVTDQPINVTSTPAILSAGQLLNSVGAQEYEIRAEGFTAADVDEESGNPFLEKVSRVEYVVSNGTESKSKSLVLHQANYAVVPTTDVFYLLNGTYQSINLKSNSSWHIDIAPGGDPEGVIEPGSIDVVGSLTENTGGYDITSGQSVTFKLKDFMNQLDIIETTVTFRVTCTDPKRPFEYNGNNYRDVTINCFVGEVQPAANSYIVKPNGMPLLIPVNQYKKSYLTGTYDKQNTMPKNWVISTDRIKGRLLWKEDSNPIGISSSIRGVKGTGRGNDGYIFVAPGSIEGNGVVALTVNDDPTIKWSWHIWVTNYDPNEPVSISGDGEYPLTEGSLYSIKSGAIVIMDRNMGALSTTDGDASSKGLYYQYGRKDPFPTGVDWSNGAATPAYDEDGATAPINHTEGAVTEIYEGVNSPMTFFWSAGGVWILRNTSKNDNLWMVGYQGNGTKKSVYDPCPYGWGLHREDLHTPGVLSSDATGLTYGTVAKYDGITFGYFPFAGIKGSTSAGSLASVGAAANNWTLQSSGTEGVGYVFNNTVLPQRNLLNRGTGATVRCVKQVEYDPSEYENL